MFKNKSNFWGVSFMILVFCVSIFFVVDYAQFALAKNLQQLENDLGYTKNKIEKLSDRLVEYQTKINEKQLTIYNLGNEIEELDKKMEITNKYIKDTIVRIDGKRKSIKKASKDIVKKTIELGKQKKMVTTIIEEMYTAVEEGKSSLLELVLYSDTFNEAINDVGYLDILQDQGEESINSIKDFVDDLKDRREKLEIENEELNELLKALDYSKNVLDSQVNAKEFLIEQTKGEESSYKLIMEEAKKSLDNIGDEVNRIEKQIEEEKERLKNLKKISLSEGSIIWPTEGRITTYFKDPTYPFIKQLGQHMGIDIANKLGTNVAAAHGGIVTIGYMKWGYGNYVMISSPTKDGGMLTTLYGHLDYLSVSTGDEIKQGDKIGGMGSSGFSTGSHLHFEVRKNGTPVNPLAYLP